MRQTIRLICIVFLTSLASPSFSFGLENKLAASNTESISMDSLDYQLIVDRVNQNGNNGHKYPTTSEDYYGASSYYSNFDARLGKFDASFSTSDKAIETAISTILLPSRFPFANLNDTISVDFKIYDGSTQDEKMHFKCTSINPITFSAIEVKNIPSTDGKLHFGTDSTFDIVTWNIEHFPKSGNTTMALVKEWLVSLDANIYALQEIDDTSSFKQMVSQMDGYEAIIGEYEYAPLCFLYKTDSLSISSSYQLFSEDSRSFPREPLVMELTYKGQNYSIVNNHLKCCGDGILDSSNSYDEENRRQSAMQKLKAYIDSNWADKAVIVLGDFNDVLEDQSQNNVFQGFLDDEAHYKFADKHISFGDQSNWSYPSWPSDLDHILITDELFTSSSSQIIKIDSVLTWQKYDSDLSDHRPVGVRIKYQSSSESTSLTKPKLSSEVGSGIVVGPNPFNENIRIHNLPNEGLIDVRLIDVYGNIRLHKLSQHSSTLNLDLSQLNQGIYLIMLSGEDWNYSTKLVKR